MKYSYNSKNQPPLLRPQIPYHHPHPLPPHTKKKYFNFFYLISLHNPPPLKKIIFLQKNQTFSYPLPNPHPYPPLPPKQKKKFKYFKFPYPTPHSLPRPHPLLPLFKKTISIFLTYLLTLNSNPYPLKKYLIFFKQIQTFFFSPLLDPTRPLPTSPSKKTINFFLPHLYCPTLTPTPY